MSKITDTPQTWTRLDFDESILEGLSVRERSEIETNRDLIKPIEQLVCDVHEETHNLSRNELANIAGAQKRMVSMMARIAMSNDRMTRQMYKLTVVTTIMSLLSLILSIILMYREFFSQK
jgi:hypothetical protein